LKLYIRAKEYGEKVPHEAKKRISAAEAAISDGPFCGTHSTTLRAGSENRALSKIKTDHYPPPFILASSISALFIGLYL
jgi:hypothetical protein